MTVWVGGALLLGLAFWLGLRGPADGGGQSFLLAYSGMCLVYGACYLLRRRGIEHGGSRQTLFGILFVAVLARVCVFSMETSDDVHRYLWEGRLQQLGGNPYTIAPVDAEHWVPEPLRPDRHRTKVNHPELTTVYPPGAQILFLLIAEIRYSGPAWKLLMLLGELALVGVLLRLLQARGQSRSKIWRYVWHPLPIIAFAGEGHLDVLLLLGTWLFLGGLARGRQMSASGGLALAVQAKFLGGLYLPIALRRLKLRGWLLALVLIVVFSLPFADSGWGLIRTLVLFGKEMSYNASWQDVAASVLGDTAVRVLGLALLAGVAVWVFKRNPDPIRAGFFLTAAFLWIAPTVHPWYLTGLIPFLLFRWRGWAAIWSCTVGWAYVAYAVEAETGQFFLPRSWALAEYLPVYAAFIWWLVREWKSRTGSAELA